jgi:hypothetical protein
MTAESDAAARIEGLRVSLQAALATKVPVTITRSSNGLTHYGCVATLDAVAVRLTVGGSNIRQYIRLDDIRSLLVSPSPEHRVAP